MFAGCLSRRFRFVCFLGIRKNAKKIVFRISRDNLWTKKRIFVDIVRRRFVSVDFLWLIARMSKRWWRCVYKWCLKLYTYMMCARNDVILRHDRRWPNAHTPPLLRRQTNKWHAESKQGDAHKIAVHHVCEFKWKKKYINKCRKRWALAKNVIIIRNYHHTNRIRCEK